jgi:hypothetical protein
MTAEPPPSVVPESVGAEEVPEGSEAAVDQTAYLVVARGHRALYEQLRELVGESGRVRVIEDRRREQTLLPRPGREAPPA